MSAELSDLSPSTKADIARQIHNNLKVFQEGGGAEPALRVFLPQLAAVAEKLSIPGSAATARTLRTAEAEWAEIMIRLRGCIACPGKKMDAPAPNDGKAVLKPLLDALQTLRSPVTRGS
jgi:hypothetical protein